MRIQNIMKEIIIKKSPERIKEQIENWFFKYHYKSRTEFDGSEEFTLFDLLKCGIKSEIEERLELRSGEIPALIIKVTNRHFVINSTERVIKIEDFAKEYLDYKDFSWHKGFVRKTVKDTLNMKREGLLIDFEMIKTDNSSIFWKIPTGHPGYAFWNITKKCELIGRKYEIIK